MNESLQQITRRHFFDDCRLGLGKLALGSLLAGSLSNQTIASESMGAVSGSNEFPTHFPPKVKRVIYLFMAGAPSQLELFDHKPKLVELEGKPIPPSVIKGQRYAFIQPNAAVLGPRFKFQKHGKCGAEISEVFPHLASIADEISIVKSVHTDLFNHAPAQLFANTGSGIPGRPSMGAWLSYGIGCETKDLPSFVVLKAGGSLSGGAAMWSSGFLPSTHQGVPFRGTGDPILHLSNPNGIDDRLQRKSLDLIGKMNRSHFSNVGDPEIQTRINAYEMAYRMQTKAPELMDFSNEDQKTLEMYGAKPGHAGNAFANNCLLARRLVENGVRFVQVYHAGWDHHSNVEGGVRGAAKATDQPCAALVKDLAQRGLLEDTLVVWGGEFGRTPMVEASAALGRSKGRDHHPQAFTMWFAGGGVKKGFTIGKTDELGFNIVEDPFHMHDVQATILHLLGIDHEKLSYKFQGLNIRLTGVEEHHPIKQMMA